LCEAKELKTIDAPPGHMRMGGREPGEGGQLFALKQGPPSDERILPWGRASGVEPWEGEGPQGIACGMAAYWHDQRKGVFGNYLEKLQTRGTGQSGKATSLEPRRLSGV
jgi:hypothetical protein